MERKQKKKQTQTQKQTKTQKHNHTEHASKQTKTLFITALVLFLAVISAVMVFHFTSPSPVEGSKAVTVQIVDDKNDLTTYQIHTDAEYLRQVLEECPGLTFIGSEGPYGLMLSTINGVTASYDKNQAWWSIYVNEELGNYGVDQQTVTNGDVFRLQYTTEANQAE